MNNLNKPNLFIAGAPKAGTTFLYQQLKGNKVFFFPAIKELNFFSNKALDQSSNYYQDYRVNNITEYLRHYKESKSEKYLVDSSVSYFSFKQCAEEIYLFNNDAKFIFILRNPVQRTFSHYKMDQRMGYASKSFSEYIHQAESYPFHYRNYILNSKYYECIYNYVSLFGKENVCILFLEDLEKSLYDLADFLGLSEGVIEDIKINKKVNTAKKPNNPVANYFYKNRKVSNSLKKYIPENILKIYKHFFFNSDIQKDEIIKEDSDYLKKLFREDIQKLSEFTKKDLKLIWDGYSE